MKFSIEEIYSIVGQYDGVVGVTFNKGSEAHYEYGNFLVGTFIYTQKERERLEKILLNSSIERSIGMLAFKEINKDIHEEKRIKLLREGFSNIDILSLDTFKYGNENNFIKKDKKDIPNIIPIQVDFSDTNEGDFKVGYYYMRLKMGSTLIEEEWDEYYGILISKVPSIKDKLGKSIIDSETGNIKANIKFYLLQNKYRKKEISELEKLELLSFFREKEKQKREILKREIQRSGLELKKVMEIHFKEILTFVKISNGFKTEPITVTGQPIFWDYQTLCHIYLRHVEETKIGGIFKGKSVFQYDLEEIRRVIENVLKSCMQEIQTYFKDNPGKSFQRYNDQSIYFNGDYYRFRIDSLGRLEYFHSYEKDI